MYWYKQSQIITQLEKEAGWKENVQYSLMGAIVMFFLGSGISSVSKRWNVSEEEITEALQNDYIVNEAKRIVSGIQANRIENPLQTPEQVLETIPQTSISTPQTPITKERKQMKPTLKTPKEKDIYQKFPGLNADSLISVVMIHEGLVEGQTPFRYTSESMRGWNNIHGFEIDKTPRSDKRRNFIFLKNPQDVPLAIKAQFAKYVKSPNKYGWDHIPSLGEALAKFDQTGVEGKKKFLSSIFPGINFQIPLNAIFPS